MVGPPVATCWSLKLIDYFPAADFASTDPHDREPRQADLVKRDFQHLYFGGRPSVPSGSRRVIDLCGGDVY